MTYISLFIISAMLALTGCSHTNEHTSPSTAPPIQESHILNQPVTEHSKTAAPQDKSTKELAQILSASHIRGAVLSYVHQDIVMQPTPQHIRYLMRAARYAEAADFSARATQNTSMKFIHQKARILAGLCTDQNPCSKPIDDIKIPNAVLRPVYDYWRAYARIADQRFDDAVKSIRHYDNTYRQTDKARTLTLALIQNVQKAGLFNPNDGMIDRMPLDYSALDTLISKISKGANAFEAASLIHAQMLIAQLQGSEKKSLSKKNQLILRYPATQMSLWPELAPSPQYLSQHYSANEMYGRIEKLISHFDYDNARRELKFLVESSKTPQNLRSRAEWSLAGVSMTNSEEPGLSEKIYRKYADSPGSHREDAVFGISRALSRQLQYPQAIKALENYDRQFPKGKYRQRSLYLRGWYEFDLRHNQKARPLLKEYAEKTNDTAVWGFYAQSFLRDKNWTDAIAAFEHLKRGGNPIVKGKALYWQAYAFHQLDQDEKAKTCLSKLHRLYPLTWYDFLAYAREQEWFEQDADDAYIKAFRQNTDPQPKLYFHDFGWSIKAPDFPKDNELIQNILNLADHDAIREARELYLKNESNILKYFSQETRENARLYFTHLVESYNKAWEDVAGSIRAFSGTWPQRNLAKHHLAYPQPFAPLVESLSQQFGIPRFFIYGIMLQESRFRPWQVSSADAIGALQMIPRTARPIARELGLVFHPDTFFDPKVGFIYSAYYMKSHFDKWGGNLTFTAGSYNGGPHRIGPWALRDKGKTIDIIVDEFSFDESRHYARKVAEHTLRFAYLYAHHEKEWLDTVHALFPIIVPDIQPADDWGL